MTKRPLTLQHHSWEQGIDFQNVLDTSPTKGLIFVANLDQCRQFSNTNFLFENTVAFWMSIPYSFLCLFLNILMQAATYDDGLN